MRRLVSLGLLHGLLLVAFATTASAQPGMELAAPASDRDQCLAQRRELSRQAQAIVDVPERTRLLLALPDCGPAPAPVDAPPVLANGGTFVPWSEVSHINGQLVKVGERLDYLKPSKKFVIATNPLGWLVGFYGVSVSVAVSEHIAIRGNAEYFDYEFFGHTTGHELALSAPIYLRRTFSGPFLEPGFIYQETLETPWDLFGDGDETPVAHTYAGPEMLFGWHWTFDSGFNIAAALGVTRNVNTQMSTDAYDDSDDPLPTGYLRVGMAF